MIMNSREIWTTVHGMVFGFIFLPGLTGALYSFKSMKPEWLTVEGMTRAVNNVKIYMWVLAASVWAAVFTGAYIVYPWYRATPPSGTTVGRGRT